jgi:hypothetical protein
MVCRVGSKFVGLSVCRFQGKSKLAKNSGLSVCRFVMKSTLAENSGLSVCPTFINCRFVGW